MELRFLPREAYEGDPLHVQYETDCIYQVQISERGFSLKPRRLLRTLIKSWEGILFDDWLDDPVAFGLFAQDRLIGLVEGNLERWHNLFRVTNLMVEADCRGRGNGKLLLQSMLSWAKEHTDCRGIILETQTCNYPAICLYEKLGFRLCRIDTHEYSNNDVENCEVRIDLICPIENT